MSGMNHGPVKRGRSLAMGVTAALAGMLLIAVPAGAASAVEGSAVEEVVTEVETPLEGTDGETAPAVVDGETGAEEAGADPAAEAEAGKQNSDDASTQAPGEAETQEGSRAATVATHRITGTFTFGSMTSAQKKAIRVYISPPNAPGKEYTVGGKNKLNLNESTGAWSVSNITPGLYNVTIYPDKSGAAGLPPIYMNTDGYIDLRKTSYKIEKPIKVNVGAIRIGLVSPYTSAGKYQLFAINAAGKATNVTATVFAGDSSPNYPLRLHSVVLAPGTYKLRADLPNGIKVYYNGQPFGTERASEAKSIKVGLLKQTNAKTLDLRDFSDVPASAKFSKDIQWLANEGVTTGVNQPNGTLKFLPKDTVSREAMVAFLFRLDPKSGSYKVKGKSPFTDVKPGHKFYKQIMWAYENKVTTGTKQPDGSLKFEPGKRITREAMAAFMYRHYKSEISTKPGGKKLVDVSKGHKFYKEIAWMSSNGITTGVKQPNGSLAFEPKAGTSREATAAFLHRAEIKK